MGHDEWARLREAFALIGDAAARGWGATQKFCPGCTSYREEGHSCTHFEARNAELEAENERLRAELKAQARLHAPLVKE